MITTNNAADAHHHKVSVWPVLVVAATVGMICGLPHLIISIRVDGQYTPFAVVSASAITFDETIAYAPRAKEVLEGHFLSGNPHGFEHKDQPARALPALLPSMVLAGLGWLLGGSIARAFIVADFLLPPLAVICAYFVARSFKASHTSALCAAVLVVVGTDLIDIPLEFIKAPGATLTGPLLGLRNPRALEFSRTFVPQFSYTLLLLAVLLFQRALLLRRSWQTVLAGIVGGLLFYTYSYSWPYFLVGAAASALWLVAARDTDTAKHAGGVIGVALLVGSPVLLGLMLSTSAGGTPDLVRYGAGMTPLAWAAQKHRLLLTLLIVLVYPRRRREAPVVVCFLVAPFVCALGSQLRDLRLQEWHWIVRDWVPWVLLCVPVVVDARIQRRGLFVKWSWVALAVLVAVYGVNKQYQQATSEAELHVMGQDRGEGIQWLRQNAPPGSVVMGLDFDAMGFLPVYTNCDLYLPFSTLTPASMREMLQRFAQTCGTLGVSKEGMLALLAVPQGEGGPLRTPEWIGHYWTLTLARPGFRITEQDRRHLSDAWDTTIQQPTPEHLPFKADYLWVDGASMHGRQVPAGWTEVWRGQGVIICRALNGE